MADHPDRPDMRPGDVVAPETASAGDDICPDCGGSGERDGAPCETCAGTGVVTEPVGGA